MLKNLFLNAESGNNGAMTWIFVGLLVVLVIVLLVVPMFTNKKRAKQTTELHNSLKPGDVIKTVGGVIGTIKEIKKISPNDTEMVIETGEGDNKTTMTFDIQALYQILSRSASAESVAPATSDVFDEHTAKADDSAAVAEAKPVEDAKVENAENKAEEAVEKVDVKEEQAAVDTANNAAVEEQAADASAKPAAQAKPKTASTHKPVAKKSTTGTGAKKTTKK